LDFGFFFSQRHRGHRELETLTNFMSLAYKFSHVFGKIEAEGKVNIMRMSGGGVDMMIEVDHLTRDYGNGKGVFDVSFSLTRGEAFGFLGPNGAGKTTTLRHLMGFLRPQAGSCYVNGRDCWANSADIQRGLGYIPGEISFLDDMTGLSYLRFIARYRGMRDDGRMKALIDRFELDARGKIKKMSKGMKQKIGIVAAFMHDPEVLILDEPSGGLDPLMQNRFIDLLNEERARGKTILMSSHIFEEVERTCHRVGIIKDGRLAALDSIEALKAARVKSYIITLETAEDAAAFAREPLTVTGISGTRVTVSVQNNMRELITASLMDAMGFKLGDASLLGFMASYLYGFILLVCPMIFSILCGHALIARHVDNGSMASLLAAPVKRRTIAFTQMKALATGIVILVVYSTILEIAVAGAYFPGELDITKLLLMNTGLLCLHFCIGGICFFCSCLFSDAKYSLGFGAGIPFMMFALQMLGNAGEGASWTRYFTVFTLYSPERILAGGAGALMSMLVLFIGAIALFFGAIMVFTKKDLHV